MAEIFPNEALRHLIEIVPRANTGAFPVPTALFMGLFSSQTQSTVPSADSTLTGGGGSPSGTDPVTELTSVGGYARAVIGLNAGALQAAWPVPVAFGAGMRSTMVPPGTSFNESTGAFSGTVNGFFVTNAAASTGPNTGKVFFYSNFTDERPAYVNAAGYTIRVAAFWHLNG